MVDFVIKFKFKKKTQTTLCCLSDTSLEWRSYSRAGKIAKSLHPENYFIYCRPIAHFPKSW